MKNIKLPLYFIVIFFFSHASHAEDISSQSKKAETGLNAWDKIYSVLSHPRCANCHVGEDNIPMWAGDDYDQDRPHGMNINAGESRIGAEAIQCSTCHTDTNNTIPHGAPGAGTIWHLPPVEFAWFGKTSNHICEQIKDKNRNGDRTLEDLVDHMKHDLLVDWGWNPGAGRKTPPITKEQTIEYFETWTAEGAPCPQ